MELLNEREIEPFKSFEDIKKRVSSVPSPKKAIIERILVELEGQDIQTFCSRINNSSSNKLDLLIILK